MTANKRVMMLSFAHYHANFWAEVFSAQTGVTLAGVWDDDGARGADAARRFNTQFVADLDAALAICDAVAICSETVQHERLSARAAGAGKAILCEKPIATSVAAADRMIDAVAAAGVLFMQSFPKRLDPASERLRELLAGGELGRIHLVRIRHGHFYGLQDDFKSRWYTRLEQSGGGALLDEGVHATDLLCWLFGMPQSVVATASSELLGLSVEDSATALYSYADGMTAEVSASFLFAAADTSIEVYGTHGTVLVSGVDLASRDITDSGFVRSYLSKQDDKVWRVHELTPQFKRGEFHQQNALAFCRCLRDGAKPPADAVDGRNALLMVEKAYQAARSGSRQTFSD